MFARIRGSKAGNFLVDLLMLVLGINIALWFEGRFQDFQEAKAEAGYLEGLRSVGGIVGSVVSAANSWSFTFRCWRR